MAWGFCGKTGVKKLIFIFSILLNVFYFLKNGLTKGRAYLYCSTIIISFLFFSIADPIIGMPIYVYFCLASILLGFFKNKNLQFNSWFFVIWILLNLVMLTQICNLSLGLLNPKSLLLNKSNTDLLDLSSEFFVPTVDFTVIKHFVFFNMYYLFLFINLDLIKNKYLISKVLTINNKLSFLLFCIIYFEFIVANFVNPKLLDIFSIFLRFDINASWVGPYGLYVAEGRLNEPSTIIVTFPFFFSLAEKTENFGKIFFLFLFGVGGILITGSTTGILMVAFCFLFLVFNLFKKRQFKYFLTILLLFLLVLIFFASAFSAQINKLFQFLNFGLEEWGSGTFRANSIYYALVSFSQAPILGVGIGTVYCHGLFFQLISNVGILGVILFFLSYLNLFKKFKFNIFKILICFFLFMASSLIQSFTSPYFMIVVFSCLIYKKSLFINQYENLRLEYRFTNSIFNVYI